MSQLLSLYQKILIVKWYYKNDEELWKVGKLFEESFHFSPILMGLGQVVEAFELTGSVVEDVVCRIKDEHDAGLENEEVDVGVDIMAVEESDISPGLAVNKEVLNEEDNNPVVIKAGIQPNKSLIPSSMSSQHSTVVNYKENDYNPVGSGIEGGVRQFEADSTTDTDLEEDSDIETSKIHQPPRKLECKICLRIFNSKAELAHHIPKHRRGKFYYCPICNNSFSTLWEIIRHRLVHKSPSYDVVCEVCGVFIKNHALKVCT